MKVIPASATSRANIEEIDSDVAAVLSGILWDVQDKRKAEKAKLASKPVKKKKRKPIYEAVCGREATPARPVKPAYPVPTYPAPAPSAAPVSNPTTGRVYPTQENVRRGLATKEERRALLDVYKAQARAQLAKKEAAKSSTQASVAPVVPAPSAYAQPPLDIHQPPRLADAVNVTVPAEVVHAVAAQQDELSPYSGLPYVPMGELSGAAQAGRPISQVQEMNIGGGTVRIDLPASDSSRPFSAAANAFQSRAVSALTTQAGVPTAQGEASIYGYGMQPDATGVTGPRTPDGRLYDISGTNHYLDLAGIPAQEYGTNFTPKGDAREQGWSYQREIFGFDEREIWNLDAQFMQWLYCRCMFFMDHNLCSDVYVEFEGRVMSQRHALETICGDALFAIKNQFSQDDAIVEQVAAREQRAAKLWAEVLPNMWYE